MSLALNKNHIVTSEFQCDICTIDLSVVRITIVTTQLPSSREVPTYEFRSCSEDMLDFGHNTIRHFRQYRYISFFPVFFVIS